MSNQPPLRRHPRAPIELRVEYTREDFPCVENTLNVSASGLFVETSNPLDVGTVFPMVLHLPGEDNTFTLEGEVVWLNSEERKMRADMDHFGMGIQFVFSDDNHRKTFEQILNRVMTNHLGDMLFAKLDAVSKSREPVD